MNRPRLVDIDARSESAQHAAESADLDAMAVRHVLGASASDVPTLTKALRAVLAVIDEARGSSPDPGTRYVTHRVVEALAEHIDLTEESATTERVERGGVVTEWEYGFESPQPGLHYTTTNVLLAETMHAACPEAQLLRRPFVPWEHSDLTEGDLT